MDCTGTPRRAFALFWERRPRRRLAIPYELSTRLVLGVASSALFDLADTDEVFRSQGEESYRESQERLIDEPLAPGAAFPFIQRLLSLNELSESADDPLVEVIILSKNDADTGLRVMRSIAHHGLGISRAVFLQGRSPHEFIPAFDMSLFLSADAADVRAAMAAGHPAGHVRGGGTFADSGGELRIAFDFDGVLADDASERVMSAGGLREFHDHESAHNHVPLARGPLFGLLAGINRIQRLEEQRRREDPDYAIRVRVALVTARNAPSHERAVRSLQAWGVTVNDAFFLGGVPKDRILEILRPHVFFDDQPAHLLGAAKVVPSVHVPFGAVNA